MIVSTRETCWGAPRLDERRLTVADMVLGVYYEKSLTAYALDHEIDRSNVIDALTYCAQQRCKTEALNYCDKCLLRFVKDLGQDDNDAMVEINYEDNTKTTVVNGQHFFLGSQQEYDQQKMGQMVWLIAEELLHKYGENS